MGMRLVNRFFHQKKLSQRKKGRKKNNALTVPPSAVPSFDAPPLVKVKGKPGRKPGKTKASVVVEDTEPEEEVSFPKLEKNLGKASKGKPGKTSKLPALKKPKASEKAPKPEQNLAKISEPQKARRGRKRKAPPPTDQTSKDLKAAPGPAAKRGRKRR